MSLGAAVSRWRLAFSCLVLLAFPALASGAEEAGGEVAQPLQISGQYQSFQGNNGLLVISPALGAAYAVDDRTSLALRYTLDSVSAASFNYAKSKTHMHDHRDPGTCYQCHTAVDAMSGASRTYLEVRHDLQFSVKRRVAETGLTATYGRSQENDYLSQAFKVGVDQDLFGRDTNLSLTVQHLDDAVSPVWNRQFNESLSTNAVDFFVTQVLTPLSEVRAGIAYADARGYQSDPYAFIQVGSDVNTTYPQVHPLSKQRVDGVVAFKQALPYEAAAELGYRYYQDSWEVHGHTVDFLLARSFFGFMVEPEYRYYVQNKAAFFKNFYGQPEALMTRDLKLADFSTHFLSLGVHGPLAGGLSGSLRYSRYWRVDSLDYSLYFADAPLQADLLQVGLSYP